MRRQIAHEKCEDEGQKRGQLSKGDGLRYHGDDDRNDECKHEANCYLHAVTRRHHHCELPACEPADEFAIGTEKTAKYWQQNGGHQSQVCLSCCWQCGIRHPALLDMELGYAPTS